MIPHFRERQQNCNGIEKTFATLEAQREFLKSLGGTEVAAELGKHDDVKVRFSVIFLFLKKVI